MEYVHLERSCSYLLVGKPVLYENRLDDNSSGNKEMNRFSCL